MKNLFHFTFKALSLTVIVLSLTSSNILAGGDKNIKAKNDSSANAEADADYAEAIQDLEKDLLNTENEEIYDSSTRIKIYDSEFNLMKEITLTEEYWVEDKEILSLLRQSSELMHSHNITYYIID